LFIFRFAFITKKTPEEAEETLKQLEGFSVTKTTQHTYRIEQIEKVFEINENYEPPPEIPFEPKLDMYSWMLDPYGKNQFFVNRNENTQIFLFDPIRGTESILDLV
jgi:hypothetical protein